MSEFGDCPPWRQVVPTGQAAAGFDWPHVDPAPGLPFAEGVPGGTVGVVGSRKALPAPPVMPT